MLSSWTSLAKCPSFATDTYASWLISLNIHFLFNTRGGYQSQFQEWKIPTKIT